MSEITTVVPGCEVWHGVIPRSYTDAALRRINLEVVSHGLSSAEIRVWADKTAFPWLRSCTEIKIIQNRLDDLIQPAHGEQWCEPQILIRYPDFATTWPLMPHVDWVPEWAGNRKYRAIFGVPLTSARKQDGCLAVWPGPVNVELDPGDVVKMSPDLGHSGQLNRSANVRYALYYRLLRSE